MKYICQKTSPEFYVWLCFVCHWYGPRQNLHCASRNASPVRWRYRKAIPCHHSSESNYSKSGYSVFRCFIQRKIIFCALQKSGMRCMAKVLVSIIEASAFVAEAYQWYCLFHWDKLETNPYLFRILASLLIYAPCTLLLTRLPVQNSWLSNLCVGSYWCRNRNGKVESSSALPGRIKGRGKFTASVRREKRETRSEQNLAVVPVKMRTFLLFSCLVVACYGFTAKRLLLDLARLRAREIEPDVVRNCFFSNFVQNCQFLIDVGMKFCGNNYNYEMDCCVFSSHFSLATSAKQCTGCWHARAPIWWVPTIARPVTFLVFTVALRPVCVGCSLILAKPEEWIQIFFFSLDSSLLQRRTISFKQLFFFWNRRGVRRKKQKMILPVSWWGQRANWARRSLNLRYTCLIPQPIKV